MQHLKVILSLNIFAITEAWYSNVCRAFLFAPYVSCDKPFNPEVCAALLLARYLK
jgi:hypothetical protein